VKASVK